MLPTRKTKAAVVAPSNEAEKNTTIILCLKKNLNASRPFKHPPVRGKNVDLLDPIFFITAYVCPYLDRSAWVCVPTKRQEEHLETDFV